jgi:hypothetical protein
MSLALSVFYLSNPFVWAMTAALLLMPLVSFLLRLIASRFVSAAIKAPPAYVFTDEEFDIIVEFKNRSFIPIAMITAEVDISSAYSAEIETATLSLPGRNSSQMIFRLKAPHSSVAAIKIRGIWSSSYGKGIFLKIKSVSDLVHIPVIPSEKTGANEISPEVSKVTEQKLTEIAAKLRSQNGEFSGIRLFSEGDRESRIHWKLSAKSEDLLVRNFTDQTMPNVLLVLFPTDIENTPPEVTDRLFRDAKRFAAFLCSENIPCSFILRGYDFLPREAGSELMINRALSGMIYLLFTANQNENLKAIPQNTAFDIVIEVRAEEQPLAD